MLNVLLFAFGFSVDVTVALSEIVPAPPFAPTVSVIVTTPDPPIEPRLQVISVGTLTVASPNWHRPSVDRTLENVVPAGTNVLSAAL